MKIEELEGHIRYVFDERRKYLKIVKQLGEYGETKYEILNKLHQIAGTSQKYVVIYSQDQKEKDEITRCFSEEFSVQVSENMEDGWPAGHKILIGFKDE